MLVEYALEFQEGFFVEGDTGQIGCLDALAFQAIPDGGGGEGGIMLAPSLGHPSGGPRRHRGNGN